MCGIVGAVATGPIDPRVVERMRDRLVHRGPDSDGLWRSDDGRVCLGHRRLKIVDLSPEADQPFVSSDGRFVVVLNGEVYNFRSLRRELDAAGAVFRTSSDTEVLLEAYRRWGPDCLDRLSGMFAFAVWDSQVQELFCARDRAGEKPFYYAEVDGAFVFASELKSLLAWPHFRRELDATAVVDFFSFGFVPDPKTIWHGVSKLPPGHRIRVTCSGTDSVRIGRALPYWELEFDPDYSVTDWGPEIRQTLETAAAEMSFADVPVGTFLSGGVDSSSVVAALSRTGKAPRTFTIGFEEDGYDERSWAGEVARRYGTSHTEKVVHPADVEPVFRDKILWHYDEPFNDFSYLPTYYVCRQARRDITVALSGDGGDELFGGYGKYRRLALRGRIEQAVSQPVSQFVAGVGRSVVRASSPWNERLHQYQRPAADLLRATLTTGFAARELRESARGPLADALEAYDPQDTVRGLLEKARPEEVGLTNAMRYLDLKLTLASGILVKVDRASMAVSLEARPVFLHRDVLDLAARIPPEQLADGHTTKKVLKDAVREWLPASVVDRPKMGFALPLGTWLRRDLQPLTDRVATSQRLQEFLHPRLLSRISEGHAADGTGIARLHSLLFFDHWLERWA